jgi:hypothetical protein
MRLFVGNLLPESPLKSNFLGDDALPRDPEDQINHVLGHCRSWVEKQLEIYPELSQIHFKILNIS